MNSYEIIKCTFIYSVDFIYSLAEDTKRVFNISVLSLFFHSIPLGNDLDSIRALFSEKEKELSLAAAKVEALKRQLEEIRRHRHGTLNLIPGAAAALNSINLHSAATGLPHQRNGGNTSSAARELEKLRRELMVNSFIY